jgi:hypothetical protein
MIKHDVNRVKQAVQYLVDSSYFKHHVKKLRNAVEKPRSMPFKEDAEVLNELLLVGRQNREAMESLLSLANFKRDDHNEYQRKFMAAKRSREKRVLTIEQTMLGRDYTFEEARAALARHYDVWNQEKEVHVAACRTAYLNQFGEEPSWQQRNQFIKDFWALKDMELDMMEEEAKKVRTRMVSPKRRLVVVAPPVREGALRKLGQMADMKN